VTNQTGLVWSDEMKVGLIGQGRRRSLSSWSEAAPESADGAGMLLSWPWQQTVRMAGCLSSRLPI